MLCLSQGRRSAPIKPHGGEALAHLLMLMGQNYRQPLKRSIIYAARVTNDRGAPSGSEKKLARKACLNERQTMLVDEARLSGALADSADCHRPSPRLRDWTYADNSSIHASLIRPCEGTLTAFVTPRAPGYPTNTLRNSKV
ncbi:hypothetical protein KM043_016675 [Ampulex compressa]|nr:hypothetical protein KM043_016675 [Ampulex compressa]